MSLELCRRGDVPAAEAKAWLMRMGDLEREVTSFRLAQDRVGGLPLFFGGLEILARSGLVSEAVVTSGVVTFGSGSGGVISFVALMIEPLRSSVVDPAVVFPAMFPDETVLALQSIAEVDCVVHCEKVTVAEADTVPVVMLKDLADITLQSFKSGRFLKTKPFFTLSLLSALSSSGCSNDDSPSL